MSEFHVREAASSYENTTPKVKPAPKTSKIPSKFFYAASNDGTDENLLVLLHGLGDTEIPFSKLGKSLKLPQTAVLALRAPEQVPFLYEDAFQWYTSFDDLGETILHPNPTPALQFMHKVVDHLITDCAWPASRIHFFGFAQGGSVAAEFVLERWKRELESQKKRITSGTAGGETQPLEAFGSVTSISGPLLSYPTPSKPSPTPALVVHRSPPAETALPSGALEAFKKGFSTVIDSKLGPKPEGMPASRQEWESIMRFWSERLSKRTVSGLYEVMTGAAAS
ncbi:hypothetical protein D9613_011710 [Agrocybe pediades]|uniref:Phospholipase/carboxylesterase/thioesterase domain-containing protein n=1 Tax=Agrocybe pediades TaxID=84607 RepID=A0A8H4QKQ7_9AGAR|nr:hypothetical protein D9613_011710 [Agrocybe pediades]